MATLSVPHLERAIAEAKAHAFDIVKEDGHWNGELQSNSTITSEYIFMCTALNLSLATDGPALRQWLEADQAPDGSWNLGHGLPGNISATVESYMALKILGVDVASPNMVRAKDFIYAHGGVEKVRVFTRIFLAMFGLFSWSAVPQMPAELILVPNWSRMSVYRMASWARGTVVPLLVICHHRPVFALPNGQSAKNDFLDELWHDPSDKVVPYTPTLWNMWMNDGSLSWKFGFTLADKSLYCIRTMLKYFPVRSFATRKCMEWVLDRQEESGDWAGIFPPMINSILALHVEGYALDSGPMRKGLEAMERFAWRDKRGMRVQACTSPVWDTILMTIGLLDAGTPESDPRLKNSVEWVRKRQILDEQAGDWRIYRPNVKPGGWAFEYFNTHYPDIDDTAAAILAFVKQDPKSVISSHVIQAVEWILGMQNPDGGWAAFDVENNNYYLNEIPFDDMKALCDPSTADVTGRVLEAFGLFCSAADTLSAGKDIKIMTRVMAASTLAIRFLDSIQEQSGSWWGRWGVNYIYGTSNVLCALAYVDGGRVVKMTEPALQWLKDCQQSDGGWGEGLHTYKEGEALGQQESTASQTAWAVMGLLAHLPPTDEAIRQGVRFLVDTQTRVGKTATWEEPHFTGTGFPGHFYLRYDYYRHCFPLMALGRYKAAVEELKKRHVLT